MIAHQTRSSCDTEIAEALRAGRGRAPRTGHKTILVIDDDRGLCHALSIRLKQAGLNVECAFDGATGIKKIKDIAPDLVILDLILPRMHGFTLLHFLRMQEDAYQGPIVLLTGDRDPELFWHALQWNVARLFQKPVDHRHLVWAIQRLLM
jgi:DNA-binding response OmpR family regulator